MESVVPDLLDALVTQTTTLLPEHLVSDGLAVTKSAGDFLMVGYDLLGSITSGESVQTFLHAGQAGLREEEGEVVLSTLSWNGNNDAKAARDSVYATFGTIAELCRSNPDLGVAELLWVRPARLRFDQDKDKSGAYAVLGFTLYFKAQL